MNFVSKTKLGCLSLCLLFAALGCKPRRSSQVQDEGFTRVEQRSYDEILSILQKLYNLTALEQGQLKIHLKNAILSSFRIRCGEERGTGFFIGKNGEFVTAGHSVIENESGCFIISVTELDNLFAPKVSEHSLEILASLNNGETDLSHGRIVGFQNANFIKIPATLPPSQEKIQPRDTRTFVIGFPISTVRDGTVSSDTKDKYDFVISDWLCSDDYTVNDLRSYAVYVKSLGDAISQEEAQKGVTDLMQHHDTYKFFCEYQKKNSDRLRSSGYDRISGIEALGMLREWRPTQRPQSFKKRIFRI